MNTARDVKEAGTHPCCDPEWITVTLSKPHAIPQPRVIPKPHAIPEATRAPVPRPNLTAESER